MKLNKKSLKPFLPLALIPILAACGGKTVGIAHACPSEGSYVANVIRSVDADDLVLLGGAKFIVADKTDFGTYYIIGLQHEGEACIVSTDMVHSFKIEKTPYDVGQFLLTIDKTFAMTATADPNAPTVAATPVVPVEAPAE